MRIKKDFVLIFSERNSKSREAFYETQILKSRRGRIETC